MKKYHKEFIVKAGNKISLKDFDANKHTKGIDSKEADIETRNNLKKLSQLQYLMYTENKNSLIIILQGLDASGKDGVIRHVLTAMNPQGCIVTSFKQPTSRELGHDFLWRVHPHAPQKGTVAIFNRSYYEDVLPVVVHKKISKEECLDRYDRINEFEKLLYEENNTTILKFFLHISKEEQLDRFEDRLKEETKQWKITEADYKERLFWDSYTMAFEELFKKTSTKNAPWYIIPSNHKWFRDLSISQIIKKTLEDLDMKSPPPAVDIDEIRLMFHTAVKTQKLNHDQS